jgi:DNA-binding NtrC family response regulator
VQFVFLDLTMPRMDGAETLRALRKLQPDLRVLIMSGFSAQDVATRFEDDAHVDFIQKPFNLSSTREKIRQLLA